jgi:hypothetical protein
MITSLNWPQPSPQRCFSIFYIFQSHHMCVYSSTSLCHKSYFFSIVHLDIHKNVLTFDLNVIICLLLAWDYFVSFVVFFVIHRNSILLLPSSHYSLSKSKFIKWENITIVNKTLLYITTYALHFSFIIFLTTFNNLNHI